MIDGSTCAAVERDPGRLGGAWLFSGTRVAISALFENLEDDVSLHEFVAWFPGVTAEQAGFEVLLTTDRNLEYQPNLSRRRIAIVVLLSARWPRIRRAAPAIRQALAEAGPGSFFEVVVADAR